MAEPEEYAQFFKFDIDFNKAVLPGFSIISEFDYVFKNVDGKVVDSGCEGEPDFFLGIFLWR